MKNRNLITKYLILIIPLLFMSLNAQDDVDPVEAASQAKAVAEAAVEEVSTPEGEETATEEVATPEGEEAATGEAGEATLAEETFDTLAAVVEGEFDSLDVETGPLADFSIGLTGSVGFINGGFITNTPMGGSVVLNTPWGFSIGNGIDFGISLTAGIYNGEGNNEPLNALLYGVGGNLTLINLVFAEGHAGIVGAGPGIRGFAGVSLEYLMKKGLNLPVYILVGGEGFITTNASDTPCTSCEKTDGIMTYWGGLGVRLDYEF